MRLHGNALLGRPSFSSDMNALKFHTQLAQTGTLSPRLQHAVRLLHQPEHADAPWSDAEFTRQPCQQGFKTARRTVTKYRQCLSIAARDRRRSGSPATSNDALDLEGPP